MASKYKKIFVGIAILFFITGCQSKYNFKNRTVFLVTNREKSTFKNQFRSHVGDKNLWMHIHTQTGKYDYREQDLESFFKLFLKQTGKNDLIVFIHGSGKSIKTVTKRSIRIESIYKMPVIAFDWATHKTPGPIVYRKSRSKAKQSASYLKKFLDRLFAYKKAHHPNIKIHLLMHSMGNHVYESMIITKDYDPAKHPFKSIIFSAPDILKKDQKKMFEKLKKHDSNIFVLYNRGDFVLWWAQFFMWKDRVGKRADRPITEKHINFINMSEAKKVGCRHEYIFHPSENFLQFMNNILNGETPENKVLLTKNKNIWKMK